MNPLILCTAVLGLALAVTPALAGESRLASLNLTAPPATPPQAPAANPKVVQTQQPGWRAPKNQPQPPSRPPPPVFAAVLRRTKP